MHILCCDKEIDLHLSPAALAALARRHTPLLAEMELLFSCLIRKRVRFRDLSTENAIPVSDRLSIRFRPVMTRTCAVAEVVGAPPLEDFPIANPKPYVPRWLRIDYRRGDWQGEFGY